MRFFNGIKAKEPTSRRSIGWLIVASLLILRFIAIPTQVLPESPLTIALIILFEVGTYLLTGLMIWWERERLSEFFIDLGALIAYVCQLYFFPIGLGFAWFLKKRKIAIPSPPAGIFRWLLIGAALGILAQGATIWLGWFPAGTRTAETPTLLALLITAPLQILNAGVMEEPLFRGFLWGYLRRWELNNLWIWILQAVLFALAHANYLQHEPAITMFPRMILPALVFGLVAWKSRSLLASMTAHGFANATGDLLAHYRSLSEANWVICQALIAIGVLFLVDLGLRRFRRAPILQKV